MIRLHIVVLLAMIAIAPAAASAQTTRADVARQQRAAKSTTLKPYVKGKIESRLFRN